MIRSIGKMFMTVGTIAFLLALIWWLGFFHQMLGDDIKRASECFYSTTMECQIGNLIGGFTDIPAYDPILLWVAGAMMGLGLLFYTLAPHG